MDRVRPDRVELGYIFDLDGVLTDTVEHHYRSWKELADELRFPFTREDNEALRGRSRRDALELFLRGRPFPEGAKREIMARKNALFSGAIAGLSPANLLPGALDLLREAKAAGIRLGVGSASRNARTVCGRLGILELLGALGDGDRVVNPKPAPDIFIWVAGASRGRGSRTSLADQPHWHPSHVISVRWSDRGWRMGTTLPRGDRLAAVSAH